MQPNTPFTLEGNPACEEVDASLSMVPMDGISYIDITLKPTNLETLIFQGQFLFKSFVLFDSCFLHFESLSQGWWTSMMT